MTVESLLTRPVTILYREGGGADDWGSERQPPREVEAQGELQRLRQQSGDEPEMAGELSDTEWRLFVDASRSDLATADAVRVDGVEYELVGVPWSVWNPRKQAFSHVEVTVRSAQ